MGSWLATGSVMVESAGRRCQANVVNGEFSGEIAVKSLASFTLSVFFGNDRLFSETFNFPEKADYIVVSDIDDTILVTEVTSKAKMVYNSLLKKFDKRRPVQDTPELYQQLSRGNSPLGKPHFVYLSSSPSFLSRLLKTFIQKHEFPQGTIILKKSLASGGHDSHKSGWLKKVAARYPGKPLVLIGDSGEQDPFIYSSFIDNSDYSSRVKGIIIHEVTNRPQKVQALEQISQNLEKRKIPFIFWNCIDNLKEKLQRWSLLH